MTGWAHYVHKFKSSPVFLPISHDEHIKDVFFERLDTVLIHCVTIDEETYMFTICIEYNKSPFDLTEFLKSLENSPYGRLLKDIEHVVDKKEWVNKEGLPLNARSMASKVRQTVISLDIVTATNRSIVDKMKAIELIGQLASQGGSIGSAVLHAPASGAQGAASTRSRVVIPSTSKWQKLEEVPLQSKRMQVSRPAEGSIAFVLTKIPSDLEPRAKTDYNKTKTIYEKFLLECQDCFVFEVDKKFSISIN